jgi:lipase maturation factor 1
VLCLFLLDDPALLKLMPSKISEYLAANLKITRLSLRDKAPAAFAAALITVLTFTDFFRLVSVPGTLHPLLLCARQCCIFNHYGLFAVMTTQRDEIIIEGSNDGNTWLPYEFKYKPGDVCRPPCIVAPMQPRLDWQMWFAALGNWEQSPWFINFMARLFQGSSSVLGLLDRNPFPDAPPHYLRARLYRYYFSDISSLVKTGQWWHRELLGDFMPQLQLR